MLDPFMGSGTTTNIAMLLGRKSVGIDINPRYIDTAKKGVDCADVSSSNKLISRAKD